MSSYNEGDIGIKGQNMLVDPKVKEARRNSLKQIITGNENGRNWLSSPPHNLLSKKYSAQTSSLFGVEQTKKST